MAQLVIAAAGAAIGGAIAPGVVALGLTGSAIGWGVGSVIGASFGPTQRVKGPRLEDLRVTGTEYGQTIPWVAGHPRVAGQIWWASERREISTTTEVGGKGGGGVESTTYTYEVDLLVGLSDNEIPGVTRIWSNGKLIYSALAASDLDSAAASADSVPWSRLTVYTGASDQMPDATYEAAVGAGNAPAYRGRGSVFIESLQLGSSGAIPNLTFEISPGDLAATSFIGAVVVAGLMSTKPMVAHQAGDLLILIKKNASGSTPSLKSGFTDMAGGIFGGLVKFRLMWMQFADAAAYDVTGITDEVHLYLVYRSATPVGSVVSSSLGPTLTIGAPSLATESAGGGYVVQLGSSNNRQITWGGDGSVRFNQDVSVGAGDIIVLDTDERVANSLVGDFDCSPASFMDAACFELAPSALGDGVLQTQTLQSVVEAICARVGMPAGTYDATALASITKPVRAFALSQVGSARAALEQLQAAFFFDAFTTDKLYFVPRGGASVETIAADDLGSGLDAPADERLPLTVANDVEIFAQVALTYSNVDADYNADTQHSDRLITEQISTSSVQLALGMTAAEAKGVADAMVMDAYISRVECRLALPMLYAELTPTDVVTATDDDGNTYRIRIVRRTDSGPLMELDGVLDDASALQSAGITSDDYAPNLTVPARADTLIEPMDIPILRDADDGPGWYVAAQSSGSGSWPGCVVMQSSDDVTFTNAADVAEEAVIGTCTTTLGNWSGGWTVDTVNTLTVDVGSDTLSSTTADVLIADATVNAMLVGSEIIRYQTATLVSPGVYTLSRLLRGLRGTEWAISTHAAAERCVLLRPTGLRRVPTSLAARGQTYYVRGITRGQSLASVASETFTDLGVGMMPYAPVDVRGVRTTEHIVVTWKRRSRYVTSVTGILSAPLGEATEAYRVTILSSGGAALREVDTDEPVLYYDVDDVESDYGSLPPMIMLSIAQLGAGGIVGRTTTVALEVNTGVEVPGGGVTPDDGEQTPTLDLQIWHAGGSNVLVYRPVEGVAASLYVSSGTTLTAQAWPATPRPISRRVYYSDQLSIVVGASYYRLGFYTPFVPGTSSPTTLVGHVVPSAIGSAPVAVGDPPDYMIGGTTPPRCLGYDGTTVYGISMDRQDGALWSADSWPDPTGWTFIGALTQTGTESSPPWPWWQEGLNRLLKTTAGWIYVHSDGVWRTTQAVPQTGWDRIEAVSNDTGGWPHSPWWHLDALVDGARVYLCGPEYCAVSTDSGATWTVTSLPAPVPTNPYTIPDATFARLGKLGTNVVAITDGGTRVAINDGSGTGWTEHATSGIETYPTQYAGNRGRVDHAVSDGTRLWVVEREIVSQVAITPADPVTYSRFRVRVSTDGVNYSSPEFA